MTKDNDNAKQTSESSGEQNRKIILRKIAAALNGEPGISFAERTAVENLVYRAVINSLKAEV